MRPEFQGNVAKVFVIRPGGGSVLKNAAKPDKLGESRSWYLQIPGRGKVVEILLEKRGQRWGGGLMTPADGYR